MFLYRSSLRSSASLNRCSGQACRNQHQHKVLGDVESSALRTSVHNRSVNSRNVLQQALSDDQAALRDLFNSSPAVHRHVSISEANYCKEDDLRAIVQKFCPVLVFHPDVRFQTDHNVTSFLHPCKNMAMCDIRRQVQMNVQEQDLRCTEESIAKVHVAPKRPTQASCVMEQLQQQLREQKQERGNTKFPKGSAGKSGTRDDWQMEIRYESNTQSLEDSKLGNVPLLAKLRHGRLMSGLQILDIEYSALIAYRNPNADSHAAHYEDCERLTVRCTPEGGLIAVHYGSYESRDGTWIPATDCPVDGKTGRLLGFIPLTGHGIHPVPDQLETAFPATPSISPDSRVWGSKECLIVGYPDNPLMSSKVSLDKLKEMKDHSCDFHQPCEERFNVLNIGITHAFDEHADVTAVIVRIYCNFLGSQERLKAVLRISSTHKTV